MSRSTVTPIFPPPLSPWCRQRHAVAEPLINRSVYPKKNIKERKIVKKGKQKQEKNSVSRGGTGKREKGRSVGKRPVRGACCMHQGPMKGACLSKAGRGRLHPRCEKLYSGRLRTCRPDFGCAASGGASAPEPAASRRGRTRVSTDFSQLFSPSLHIFFEIGRLPPKI